MHVWVQRPANRPALHLHVSVEHPSLMTERYRAANLANIPEYDSILGEYAIVVLIEAPKTNAACHRERMDALLRFDQGARYATFRLSQQNR